MSNFIIQAFEDLWDKTNHLFKVGLGAGSASIGAVTTDVKNVLDASMGNLGATYSGAATITPASTYIFNAIQVITNAVITCVGNPSGITSVTLTAGTIIYGRFTSITIASGTVIAYQGK
jgi:hypothetical protein